MCIYPQPVRRRSYQIQRRGGVGFVEFLNLIHLLIVEFGQLRVSPGELREFLSPLIPLLGQIGDLVTELVSILREFFNLRRERVLQFLQIFGEFSEDGVAQPVQIQGFVAFLGRRDMFRQAIQLPQHHLFLCIQIGHRRPFFLEFGIHLPDRALGFERGLELLDPLLAFNRLLPLSPDFVLEPRAFLFRLRRRRQRAAELVPEHFVGRGRERRLGPLVLSREPCASVTVASCMSN